MRALKKLFYAVVFLTILVAGLTFTARNPQHVHLSWYFGVDHDLPLTLVLFGALALGMVLGYVFGRLRPRRRRPPNRVDNAPGSGLVVPGKG